ncbi:hypothetical protein OIU77_012945 [Salix suchowensis]|uniref:Glycoside hydrolase family 3 C-terminal domain-containing protein n=1 Tax=Salix suchowensis TaxID=1278906 RepID=A0ABQ9A5K3_9ROSI|nr:hypothetical protein OIU77_012945 [Salix suchowensis]
MTLEEKIGQMVQLERANMTAEIMRKYHIGSLLSGGGSVPADRASPRQWVDMVNTFQKGSLSTRLGIPMIYGIDAVHGHNNVYKATIFPHNVGLGVTRDPALVKKIGAATALEVRATGIPYAFAPCIAVCRDPRWGRCYESYSEDHKIVQMMTEIIPGLQGDVPANFQRGTPFCFWQRLNAWILMLISPRSTTILKGIQAAVDPSTKIVFKENPDTKYVKSQGFSHAIVVVGELPYAETAGDNLNLTLPYPGPEIINNVCGAVKCVVVIVSGRPLVIESYVPKIDALVAAWLPGSEGQGVADVLFGDHGFTGKLARTWFKRVDQLPMNVGDKHYDPLFPFGFGLETKPSN